MTRHAAPALVPVLLGAALLLGGAARPTAAQTPALGFTPGATDFEDSAADFGASSYTLGFTFSANQPLTVTDLGWFFDPAFVGSSGAPAPDAAHPVGLYDAGGALLASATVTYDGSGAGFSYAAIPGLSLSPGVTYVLAGVTGPDDPFLFDVQDPTQPGDVGLLVDPALTYGADRIAAGGTSLADFPTGSDSANGVDPAYFGPSFRFQGRAPAVPEASPAALALLGAPVLALGAGLRRRRAPRP